jgi:hypothetical protein
MEKKYNPIEIHAQAWRQVFIPGENLQPHEVSVIIEVKSKHPYRIFQKSKDDPIQWGQLSRLVTRHIQDAEAIYDDEAIYKDRDLLGKVTVKYRKEEKPWSSFEEFWNVD